MAEENLPLEIFNLIFFFIGKTGLIAFITVFCTLVGCQHPTAACTGLNKNNCKRRLSGEKEGAAAVR